MIMAWMPSKQYWFGGQTYSSVLVKQRGSNNSDFSCKKNSINVEWTSLSMYTTECWLNIRGRHSNSSVANWKNRRPVFHLLRKVIQPWMTFLSGSNEGGRKFQFATENYKCHPLIYEWMATFSTFNPAFSWLHFWESVVKNMLHFLLRNGHE